MSQGSVECENKAALEQRNEDYVEKRRLAGFHGQPPGPSPSRRMAVVTCMDARLFPEDFLGLGHGESHIIRNGGGQVTEEVINTLAVSQTMLGTREVYLIRHTDCGYEHLKSNDVMVGAARLKIGLEAQRAARERDFRPITDQVAGLRADMEALRRSPLIHPECKIYGYIIDTDSGELSEVKPLEGPGEREGQPQPAGQAQADKPGLMSSIKQEVERILPALGAGMAQPPAGSADAQL